MKTREKLYSLLGDLPERNRPISARLVSEDDKGCYVLETLELDLNGREPVSAYFVRPKSGTAPRPAIIFSHSHSFPMGKNELITDLIYGNNVCYAEALARRGIAVLCIDHWCFGERSGRRESETFKAMLWRGEVMWGMMVYDTLRAVDYIVSRPDVDVRRVGTLGLSMGSTMSIWTAALDERIKTCVDLCCLSDYEELERTDGLDNHGIYYYVPSLRKHFEMADINELIIPRSHLSTAGKYDKLTPMDGLKKIEAQLHKAYAAAGAKGGFKLSIYPCAHLETRAMREEILAFLDRTL